MTQHFSHETKNESPSATGIRILVTGANGQLGKELQQLAGRYLSYDFIFLSKDDLSIDQSEAVRNTFKTNQPTHCINCAAYTAVDKAESEQEAAFMINGKAPGILAEICKEFKCRFIHISTDYVFDGAATEPYSEEATTNPQSVYGASKLEGEKRVLKANPSSIIIRTSWVYSQFGKNFVKTMLKLMSDKEEISVVNDQHGSPTYAADLAETILQIIRHLQVSESGLPTNDFRLSTPNSRLPASAGIYHFSNEGTLSWYDFALAIKELAGSKCNVNPIPTSAYPTPAKRPHYSVLDKTRIQQTFQIELKDWRLSLATCIQRLSI